MRAAVAVVASWVGLCALPAVARAGVISTLDPTAIALFRQGRVVLGFDEIVVPGPACFALLDPARYAAQGILIRANNDGSSQTHVAKLPQCGSFGPNLSSPNVIGGGATAADPNWRQTVRFDFPRGASAIGAFNDGTGSHTTLTAYRADGVALATVSGNQGLFMGIEQPGIAYALWTWDFDQSVAGFSLDGVTFATSPPPVPATGGRSLGLLAVLLGGLAVVGLRHRRVRRARGG